MILYYFSLETGTKKHYNIQINLKIARYHPSISNLKISKQTYNITINPILPTEIEAITIIAITVTTPKN